jgi:hypothetical protein
MSPVGPIYPKPMPNRELDFLPAVGSEAFSRGAGRYMPFCSLNCGKPHRPRPTRTVPSYPRARGELLAAACLLVDTPVKLDPLSRSRPNSFHARGRFSTRLPMEKKGPGGHPPRRH